MPIRSREEYFCSLESDSDSDIEKEEFVLHIDENGNLIKIPYNPFNEDLIEECTNIDWVEEYKKQEKLTKINKNNLGVRNRFEETKKFAFAMNNLIEVKELEEAEYLVKVHNYPLELVSEVKINKDYTHEEIKKEEKWDKCKIFFGKKVE